MGDYNFPGGAVFRKVHEVDGAQFDNKPHGWLQWKGTDVCLDYWCPCGKQSHVDAGFAYAVRCPHCGLVCAMSPYVRLVPLTAEDVDGFNCIVDGDP